MRKCMEAPESKPGDLEKVHVDAQTAFDQVR